MVLGFRVLGLLGFRVWGLGPRVLGLKDDSGLRVHQSRAEGRVKQGRVKQAEVSGSVCVGFSA